MTMHHRFQQVQSYSNAIYYLQAFSPLYLVALTLTTSLESGFVLSI